MVTLANMFAVFVTHQFSPFKRWDLTRGTSFFYFAELCEAPFFRGRSYIIYLH